MIKTKRERKQGKTKKRGGIAGRREEGGYQIK
jgi:hypothetical protein